MEWLIVGGIVVFGAGMLLLSGKDWKDRAFEAVVEEVEERELRQARGTDVYAEVVVHYRCDDGTRDYLKVDLDDPDQRPLRSLRAGDRIVKRRGSAVVERV
jgi:hypothetical protein